jgi:uncharacterized membrane protein
MKNPLELIITVYSDPDMAGKVLDRLEETTKKHDFKISDAAVLVKDEKGKVHLHDSQDVGPGAGALFGAITGGLIGLLGGPAGAVVGAVAGAATGGVTASLVDMGFSNDQLTDLETSMPPRSSALVALVEHTWVDRLVKELQAEHGRTFRHEVDPFVANRFNRAETPQR